MVPVKRFVPRRREETFLQLLNHAGRGPVSWFPSSEIERTFSRAASSSGIGPVSELKARSITYNTHKTPNNQSLIAAQAFLAELTFKSLLRHPRDPFPSTEYKFEGDDPVSKT